MSLLRVSAIHVEMRRIAVLLCLIAGIPLAPSEARAAKLIFSDGFETGVISFLRWNPQVYDQVGGATLVTASGGGPVRSGEYALRIKLSLDDPLDPGGKLRSELRPRSNWKETVYRAAYSVPHIYEFSIFLPSDWQPDGPEIVAQWHAKVDRDEQGNQLEPRRAPPLALRMTAIETFPGSGVGVPAWNIVVHWDDTAITPQNESTVTLVTVLDPLDASGDLDNWVDWRVEVTWDWHEVGDGRLRIFKDGVEVVSYDGPNAYNDVDGVDSKIGSYKWDWSDPPDLRILYYDDVKIWREVISMPALGSVGAGLLLALLAVSGFAFAVQKRTLQRKPRVDSAK